MSRLKQVSLFCIVAGAIIAIGLCLLNSCAFPPYKTGTGTVVFRVGEAMNAKSLEPSINMDITHYLISGTGPTEIVTEFQVDKPVTDPVEINLLEVGEWTFVAKGMNDDDIQIGEDTTIVTIIARETVDAYLTLVPLPGTGTLSIDVSWTPSDIIQEPSIESSLNKIVSGALTGEVDISGDYIIDTDNVTYLSSTIATGWHLFKMILKDTGNAVFAWVDIARIVKDEITEGIKTLSIDDINELKTGKVSIDLLEDMDDPINITMSGRISPLSPNTDCVLSVFTEPGVSFMWFQDAEETTITTNTYTFNESPKRIYHVDCVGLKDNRLGIASAVIVVGESETPPPPPETPTDLAYVSPGDITFIGGDSAGYYVYGSASTLGPGGYNAFQHSEFDTNTIFLPGDYATNYVYTIPGDTAYNPNWSTTLDAVFGYCLGSFKVESVTTGAEIILGYTP